MKFLTKSLKILLIGFGTLALLVSISFGYADIPLTDVKEKYAPPPSAFISVDGMEVHFRDKGSSSDSIPIVLIHGTGASLQTFDGWTSTLSKDRRVIRMDLPGYGLTGPFPIEIIRLKITSASSSNSWIQWESKHACSQGIHWVAASLGGLPPNIPKQLSGSF